MEHLTTEFYEISREPNPDCISLDSIHKRVLKRQGILMNRYVFFGSYEKEFYKTGDVNYVINLFAEYLF